jgi:hypothetical protein
MFSLSISWQWIYNTGTIKVSLNHTLPISLYYSTHKVFNSRVRVFTGRPLILFQLSMVMSYRKLTHNCFGQSQSQSQSYVMTDGSVGQSVLE